LRHSGRLQARKAASRAAGGVRARACAALRAGTDSRRAWLPLRRRCAVLRREPRTRVYSVRCRVARAHSKCGGRLAPDRRRRVHPCTARRQPQMSALLSRWHLPAGRSELPQARTDTPSSSFRRTRSGASGVRAGTRRQSLQERRDTRDFHRRQAGADRPAHGGFTARADGQHLRYDADASRAHGSRDPGLLAQLQRLVSRAHDRHGAQERGGSNGAVQGELRRVNVPADRQGARGLENPEPAHAPAAELEKTGVHRRAGGALSARRARRARARATCRSCSARKDRPRRVFSVTSGRC
jgi:hypothetical protein